MQEVAATLTSVTGRSVHYERATPAEFAMTLETFGVPPEDAAELAHAFAETFDGRSAGTTTGVPDLLGRPARSFNAFARTAFAAGLLPSLAVAGRS